MNAVAGSSVTKPLPTNIHTVVSLILVYPKTLDRKNDQSLAKMPLK